MSVYVLLRRFVPMVFGCLLVSTAALAASPRLSFEAEAVLVSDATPGGTIALLGVGRDQAGFQSRLLTLWEVLPVDAVGEGRLALDLPFPADTSWIAVDLTSGEIAVAAADPASLREVSFPSRGIPASLDALQDARSRVAMLWVRPASALDTAVDSGAWGGRVQDGGPLDEDGAQNRGLRVRLAALTPLAAAGDPPRTLQPGDVLAAVDLDTLDLYVATLGQ